MSATETRSPSGSRATKPGRCWTSWSASPRPGNPPVADTGRELRGTGVSQGVGAGPVRRFLAQVAEPPAGELRVGAADAERARAADALEAVAADLENRGLRAGDRAGDAARDVLAAQALMARDPGLAEEVARRIEAGGSAERAVYDAFGTYREMLAGAGEYLAARVADLDDVRDRAIAALRGEPRGPGAGPADAAEPPGGEPYVLVARDLAPADTALLDPSRVAAFVTEEGGPTSHTAILARALGVPAVVACAGAAALADGTPVLVDGATGVVRIGASAAELRAAREDAARRRAASSVPTGPGATADGRRVALLANIGGPKDLAAAVDAGAEGIGLYRTEFLFLNRDSPPGAPEQEDAYRAALDAFPGGRVIVRVLDAGADKPLGFLPPPSPEPNPALGERGVRMLRRHPDVLAGQLDALARAAAGGGARLEVMAPMVADAAEAAWFADACREAGIRTGIGVMVELPSAALRARDIVVAVDFVSIGTNDLAQYAFGADRQVGALARLQDPWGPALLDLVALTADAAGDAGKGCGVCGEAAADPALACVLVGLGVTSLSMAAMAIPAVRTAVARNTAAQCREAAVAARAAATAGDARAAARAALTG
ncbi:MAG: phosphoenolpyruvate--protein phosphotransferase [Streptosporangiales bacterium]|nr:phosphoenolpyruvate--protein phosphotransferase [Streptosporangiales bacterium]